MSGIPRSTPLANLDQVIRLREGIFLTTLKELAQRAANSHRVRCSTTKTSGGTTLESVTYTYDALGNRIGMDENGTQTWTLYEGSDPIMDFNGSGSLTMRYLWGPTGIVASQTSGGTISWYLADALGSVRDLINNSGAIIDHIDFSAFGTILDQSDPSDGDRMMGFAGMELDAVTGLNLAVYREENPGTGRWNSQDPLGFGGGDANLYCYVADNPANANDPAGLAAPALLPPTAFLGPGDLVILSANLPAGDPANGVFLPDMEQWQQASSARPAKGGSGPGGGFTVSMFYAITQDDLEWIIDAYLRQNGGKPFRRIIILSHAGGGRFGPALNLRPGNNQPARMFYNSRGRTPYAADFEFEAQEVAPSLPASPRT